MAEKKQESGFTVTDRRKFTEDGELRRDVPDQGEEKPKPSGSATSNVSAGSVPTHSASTSSRESADLAAPFPPDGNAQPDMPPLPTAAEQQEQADAYHKSNKEVDSRVEMSGHSAKDFEMTFERFLASLYMTAMLQLGLMHQQGEQPHVDIIGARQTIDTLSLLAEKTKGNLTTTEQNFLQNSLYEVRMAYVEVTNALSRPPQPGAATGTSGR
jgi:hypothetical protein